jgi:Fe2+ or Zn2+ uptake regulation protein
LGIGGLKLRTHRAAVARLFETNQQVFDAKEIYDLAKTLL